MRAASLVLGVALLAGLAGSAEARRTVDYGAAKTAWAQWEAEQGVESVRTPKPRGAPVQLTFAPGIDHEVLRGGIGCSAWTVDNPISQLVRDMVADWSQPGVAVDAAAATPLAIHMDRASTFTRCVQTAEIKVTCITRVRLEASVGSDAARRPVKAEVELPTRGLGACAGLTRGIAVISRAAVSQLLDAVGESR